MRTPAKGVAFAGGAIAAAVLGLVLLVVPVVVFGSARTCQPASTIAAPVPGSLDTFLAAVRRHESGNNYLARNPTSTASGAYQFLTSTWADEAVAAGEGEYAGGAAWQAPPAVQDQVAAFMATAAYNGPAGQDWSRVADIWYLGHVAQPGELDVVPPGGNTITPRQYEGQITELMSGGGVADAAESAVLVSNPCAAANPGGEPPQVARAITSALAQVGKPYLWGGAGPDAFDCSGLVMTSYRAGGVELPRTTYDQIDVGQPVAESELLPGDLVFPDPGHVQIYLGAGRVVEAPHTGAFVHVVAMWGFWQARRVVQWTPPDSGASMPANLAKVVSDMTAPNAVKPHGVPPSYSFYRGPERDQPLPQGMQSATGWGVVYEDATGSTATNTRVEVTDEQLWLWVIPDARWVEYQSSAAPAGVAYDEPNGTPFSDGSRPADTRSEADGGTSVKPQHGSWFHFWPAQGRIGINPGDIGGAFTTFRARLVVDDPTRPDDTAAAHFVAAAGADWWASTTASWPANAQSFYARFTPVTTTWATYTGTSWTASQLEASPPPVAGA